MRLNKIVKAIAISIPLLTVAACSSTGDETAASEAEIAAQQAAQTEAARLAQEAEQVRIAAAKKEDAIKAQMEQQKQLLAENIIYFEFDKSTLSSEFSTILDAHAKFLTTSGKSVLIEGHADERGTPEYNIALGERRAKAVISYLEAMGVSSSQISIVSYGEEKAMDKSRSEAAFAANRRAVLVY